MFLFDNPLHRFSAVALSCALAALAVAGCAGGDGAVGSRDATRCANGVQISCDRPAPTILELSVLDGATWRLVERQIGEPLGLSIFQDLGAGCANGRQYKVCARRNGFTRCGAVITVQRDASEDNFPPGSAGGGSDEESDCASRPMDPSCHPT